MSSLGLRGRTARGGWTRNSLLHLRYAHCHITVVALVYAIISLVCAVVSIVCAVISLACALISLVCAKISLVCAEVSLVCAETSLVCAVISPWRGFIDAHGRCNLLKGCLEAGTLCTGHCALSTVHCPLCTVLHYALCCTVHCAENCNALNIAVDPAHCTILCSVYCIAPPCTYANRIAGVQEEMAVIMMHLHLMG